MKTVILGAAHSPEMQAAALQKVITTQLHC